MQGHSAPGPCAEHLGADPKLIKRDVSFLLGRWVGFDGEKMPFHIVCEGLHLAPYPVLYCSVLLLQSEQEACLQEGAKLQPAAGGRRREAMSG